MSNLLEFKSVLMKKNRTTKKDVKMEKIKKETSRTYHFEEARKKRKVSEKLITACLEKGRIEKKCQTLHYILENLHVVVDLNDETLITTYFKSNHAEDATLDIAA